MVVMSMVGGPLRVVALAWWMVDDMAGAAGSVMLTSWMPSGNTATAYVLFPMASTIVFDALPRDANSVELSVKEYTTDSFACVCSGSDGSSELGWGGVVSAGGGGGAGVGVGVGVVVGGGTITGLLVIVINTVSAACAVPSVTFSVNRTGVSADTSGAANVVLNAAEFCRVIASDELWVHAYLNVSSGSASLAVPLSDTVLPSDTVWVFPASTEGAELGESFTVMVTVAAPVREPESVTVSVSMILLAWPTLGAVNDGVAVAAPVSDMVGPLVRVHEYDRELPSSASLERVPFRDTVAPSVTVWGSPASAVGAVLGVSVIVIVTVSVACAVPSVTFSVNSTAVSVDTAGAVKVVSRAVES